MGNKNFKNRRLMTQEERTKVIKAKVKDLVIEAIDLIDANYDIDNIDYNHPAYSTIMDLNAALMELDWLNEDGLKTEEL